MIQREIDHRSNPNLSPDPNPDANPNADPRGVLIHAPGEAQQPQHGVRVRVRVRYSARSTTDPTLTLTLTDPNPDPDPDADPRGVWSHAPGEAQQPQHGVGGTGEHSHPHGP